MNTRSFIFFTRILAQAQISSLTSEGFFIEVLSVTILETTKTQIPCPIQVYRFYRSQFWRLQKPLSILDAIESEFYRSQFWRLQKPIIGTVLGVVGFIGHNFGDYKNNEQKLLASESVLSVTILETTKTVMGSGRHVYGFYRSQFWRLQKPGKRKISS